MRHMSGGTKQFTTPDKADTEGASVGVEAAIWPACGSPSAVYVDLQCRTPAERAHM